MTEKSFTIEQLRMFADGLSEVVLCKVSHDFETGYGDDWDYKLVPFTE